MNNADLAAIDSDHNLRPLRDRTDEALRVELAINAREAVQLMDPLLRHCAEVMLWKVIEEMALRAEEREAAAAPAVQASEPVALTADDADALCAVEFAAVQAAEAELTAANNALLSRYTVKRAAACDEAERLYSAARRAYGAKLDRVWPGRPAPGSCGGVLVIG